MSPSCLPSLLRIQVVHRELRQLQSCLCLCFPKGLYFLTAITTPYQTNSFTQEPVLSPPNLHAAACILPLLTNFPAFFQKISSYLVRNRSLLFFPVPSHTPITSTACFLCVLLLGRTQQSNINYTGY